MDNTLSTTQIIEQAVKSYAPVIVGDKQISPEQHITEIKAYCSKLSIVGINDKEGYKTTTAALSKVKKIRTAIEAKRKELKAVSLEYGKAVDGEAKRLTALVEPIELELKAKVDAIDKAIEQEREKERARRHNGMIEAGFSVSGGFYYAGIFSYSIEQVLSSKEDTFQEILQRGRDEQERLQKERQEAERIKREAQEAQAKAQEAIAKAATITTDGATPRNPNVQAAQPTVTADGITPRNPNVQAATGSNPVTADGPTPENPNVEGTGKSFFAGALKGNVRTETIAADPNSKPFGRQGTYLEGFESCRKQVLAKLQSPEKFTRAELIAFVNALNPAL